MRASLSMGVANFGEDETLECPSRGRLQLICVHRARPCGRQWQDTSRLRLRACFEMAMAAVPFDLKGDGGILRYWTTSCEVFDCFPSGLTT